MEALKKEQLTPGFKKTSFGVIPNDWNLHSFKNIITELRGGASLSPKDFIEQEEIKVLPKSGVTWGGRLKIKPNNQQYCRKEFADKNRRSLVDKTFTIIVLRDLVPSGPNIGLIVEIPNNESYILAQGVYGFKVDEKIAIPEFIIHLSNSDEYRRLMKSILVGSTQVHIRNTTLKKSKIPLPPTLTEQKAIATALSEVDELISSLDQLLTKKKAIKQGAMQELLTGKTRLKGFAGSGQFKQTEVGKIPEEWEVSKLGDIAQIATGSTPPTKDKTYYGGEFLFVGPGDLGSNKMITVTEKSLSSKGFAISRRFPKGSILFTCIGSTIGKSGIASVELTSNQQINAVFPNLLFDNHCLYYELRLIAQKIKSQAGEQAVPMVNKSEFSNFKIPLPPTLAEQKAIATVLSDMDEAIALLESKKAKYQELKQGMMQELLTGKIRLV